ncbi:MAG: DUF721 domain-containing protein [Aestuariivirga sp.]
METLDKHFRNLTRAAFARYGFAHGELTARWNEIVGEELSRFSEPKQIKWPRGAGHTSGTLVIRAAPGRGLELQHEAPLIMERINRFLGHAAIGSIKIVQAATWASGGNSPSIPKTPEKKLYDQELAGIEDSPLKAALERLGSGIATTQIK